MEIDVCGERTKDERIGPLKVKYVREERTKEMMEGRKTD